MPTLQTSSRPSPYKLNKSPNRNTCRTFGKRNKITFRVSCTGDVQVYPWIIRSKLFQEESRRDRPSRPPARVHYVCHVGLYQILVLIPERQLPSRLTRFSSSRQNLFYQLGVVAKCDRSRVSQSDHSGARQSCRVYNRLRLEPTGVCQEICQHQT